MTTLPELHLFLALFWSLTVTVGSSLPIALGIIVGCVPKSAQTTASAFFNMVFAVGCAGMAPIILGSIMGGYKNQREGMIGGYDTVFKIALFTPVFFLLARCQVSRYLEQMNNEIESPDKNA